jgi:uncharacterized zinc-type alcohol dehydrogenase-like protein
MGVTVWQAREAGAPLERAERPMLEPARDELLLQVLHCGLCHSDLSMLDNARQRLGDECLSAGAGA